MVKNIRFPCFATGKAGKLTVYYLVYNFQQKYFVM